LSLQNPSSPQDAIDGYRGAYQRGAHSRDPLAPPIALDLVDDVGGGEIRGHAVGRSHRAQADDIFVSQAIAYHADGPPPSVVIDDTTLHFSREILAAKVSTQFCRDSNQCLLPRLYHFVVRIISYRQVRRKRRI